MGSERQQDKVVRGNFQSSEQARGEITALRAAMVFDPVIAQMHNQFAILKANMMPRWRMGSIETERVMQVWCILSVSIQCAAARRLDRSCVHRVSV